MDIDGQAVLRGSAEAVGPERVAAVTAIPGSCLICCGTPQARINKLFPDPGLIP